MLHWRSFVQSAPAGENGPSESENTTFSGIWFFFSPFFLAVSRLVFTGCFICVIYVPCPECCMGPACSSHMAVPHALMRCPISRNTNRVLRPSLWLYDVWTHKSFPETLDRVGLTQTRPGALLYTFEEVCFQSPDSLLSYIFKKKKKVAELRGRELLFSMLSDSAFYFPGRTFYCEAILA